jgi:hypothetical protein
MVAHVFLVARRCVNNMDLDCFTDPVYTTSSQRDMAKAHYASMRSQVVRVV